MGTPQQATFAELVADALGCERRLEKDIDPLGDGQRYTLLCRNIATHIQALPELFVAETPAEVAAAIGRGQVVAMSVAGDYLRSQRRIALARPGRRLTPTFVPPDRVAAQLSALESEAAAFVATDGSGWEARALVAELALAVGAGLVEIAVPHIGSATTTPSSRRRPARPPGVKVEFNSASPFEDRKIRHHVQARRLVRKALASGSPLAVSCYANDVLIELLRDLGGLQEGGRLRIVYDDGSEGAGFDLGGLRGSPELGDAEDFAVSLMSMRHTEQDLDVDMAWFRNREVSVGDRRVSSETERWCREVSMSQFAELLAGGPVRMRMYPTGFAPAVVGFFQALRAVIACHPSKIEVRPLYFRGDGGCQGTPWP